MDSANNMTQAHAQVPRVGVGVILCQDQKILLGERIGSHGAHTWSCPGGHLEWNESWENCAIRETQEETGIRIHHVEFAAATNDIFVSEQKHYVTIFMLACGFTGEPRRMEPDKCLRWQWFDLNALPSPLFLPLDHLLQQGFTLPVQA